VKILFTRSNKIASRLIRLVTGEPVSHCAIEIGTLVIHSNFLGVVSEDKEDFLASVDVGGAVELPDDYQKMFEVACRGFNKKYDFGAMLYLAARALCPWLPKKNLWQCSGMYLCTEWVTHVIDGEEDSMITPFRLYERLSTNKG
jgi:hypothetical protein